MTTPEPRSMKAYCAVYSNRDLVRQILEHNLGDDLATEDLQELVVELAERLQDEIYHREQTDDRDDGIRQSYSMFDDAG